MLYFSCIRFVYIYWPRLNFIKTACYVTHFKYSILQAASEPFSQYWDENTDVRMQMMRSDAAFVGVFVTFPRKMNIWMLMLALLRICTRRIISKNTMAWLRYYLVWVKKKAYLLFRLFSYINVVFYLRKWNFFSVVC